MSANTYAPAFLIQQLKERDEQAWNILYTRIYQRLQHDVIVSLRRRHLSIQEADDMVQEALLTALQKIGHVDCEDLTALYHWIRVISYNHIRNHARKKKPYVSIDAVEYQNSDNDTAVDAFLYGYGCHELPVENMVILREEVAQVATALNGVNARDREIFLRRHLDNEKPHDLSMRYPGLKARSISQILTRTRRAIQQFYGVSGSD